MGRCLILSCSKAKLSDDKLLPAVQRYDGPPFRVFRRFLKVAPPALRDVELYILSANYGLIHSGHLVNNYDLKMKAERAREINDKVLEQLKAILDIGYSEIFISLSKEYLSALRGFEKLVPPSIKIQISNTSEGKRLSELKVWLYQEQKRQPKPEKEIKVTGRAMLHGKVIEATPEEIVELAQTALGQSNTAPFKIKDWYCLINGTKVSPKWLVSFLTGLSVSEFQASDARRVLAQLGIATHRV